MSTSTPFVAGPRRRLFSSWLWILAIVLGAGAAWSMMRLLHDTRMRRETIRLLAADKAREIGSVAANRFSALATEIFAAVPAGSRASDRDALRALAGFVARCGCATHLEAVDYFSIEPSGRIATLSGSPVPRPSATASTAPASLDVSGDRSVITVGRDRTTWGIVVTTRSLGMELFAGIPRGIPEPPPRSRIVVRRVHLHNDGSPEAADPLVRLDTLSLAVTSGSQRVFGSIDTSRIVATQAAPAPLQSLDVSVGLNSLQASISVLMPVAHDRLWINGLFLISTIVVVVLALISSRRELMLARSRSDFIAGVSHDLRMPLAQILLASETLALGRDRNDADRASLASSIVREARRLNGLVDNVLLFTRSGAVGLRANLQDVPVEELFTEAMQSVELAVADAGQHIEVAGDTSAIVRCDRGLMRQALVNLVDNAIKYGPEGQRIRLSARRNAQRVLLAVDDEGPGIPPDQRARVFDPYERLERDSTSERTGSGLGLAVVRQIVDACGGRVSIENAEIGTRMLIDLPAGAA